MGWLAGAGTDCHQGQGCAGELAGHAARGATASLQELPATWRNVRATREYSPPAATKVNVLNGAFVQIEGSSATEREIIF